MSHRERPLYLHFLDRELGNSVGVEVSGEVASRALRILILGTSAPFYAGLSLVWEHPAVDEELIRLLSALIESESLDLVSHHPRGDEFLASRRELYAHDSPRYPAYFSGQVRNFGPTLYKPEGTTQYLEGQFLRALGATARGRPAVANVLTSSAKPILAAALGRREHEAITFSLFEQTVVEKLRPDIAGSLRRSVSTLYCAHYLEFADGNIPTGIPGLTFFDGEFPRGFPRHDLKLLGRCLRALGLQGLIDRPPSDLWSFWMSRLWARQLSARLPNRLGLLLHLAMEVVGGRDSSLQQQYRPAIWGRVRDWIGDGPEEAPTGDPARQLQRAEDYLDAVIARLRSTKGLGDLLAALELEELRSVSCLLVTATDKEDDALDDEMQTRFGRRGQQMLVDGMALTDLGRIGRETIWHVRSEMGSTGPGGSIATVLEAIYRINPGKIVVPGIAFGFDEETQPIGLVLVSEALFNYNRIRAGTDEDLGLLQEARSSQPAADASLVGRFRSARRQATEFMEFGLMVSGEALVDNLEFRDAIRELAPRAIGGEMEGFGVYSAAERRHVPWIVVKAVCDWADGRKGVDKDARQRRAARASVGVVLDCLSTA